MRIRPHFMFVRACSKCVVCALICVLRSFDERSSPHACYAASSRPIRVCQATEGR